MIIVEIKSEILGNREFWRGSEENIEEIRNIPARTLAERVSKDGVSRSAGMWKVRKEG